MIRTVKGIFLLIFPVVFTAGYLITLVGDPIFQKIVSWEFYIFGALFVALIFIGCILMLIGMFHRGLKILFKSPKG